MKLKVSLATVFLLLAFKGSSQEVTNTKFGKGVFNVIAKDSSWSMKFAARMQFLSTTQWDIVDDNFGKAQSNFLVRRARLKFGGFAYSPKLQYKIELGLSNRDISGASEFTSNAPRYILDAVIKWNFYKNFTLWAGQTKLPGNRERVISSGNLQFVDRSRLNSRFNIDRDLGLQLRHHFKIGKQFLIKEAFAVSQGEGRNVTSGNLGGHQYTSRLEILPFGNFLSKGDYIGSAIKREETPKLALGFTYDYNKDAVKTRSNLGDYMVTDTGFYTTDITTFFADAMFKYKSFSFMGEFAHRDAEDAVAVQEDGITPTGDVVNVGNALSLQAGHMFKNNWELAGRYTSINYDAIVNAALEERYTIGLSKFIVGHKLKVQTDLTYITEAGIARDLVYRLQFDIHF
ncbi:porin [Aquimarina intermedia]|uniref:Phosphate-selective porin O/P n=1 Tax=Aquimarina intermedia TaxID=350814 RepID=A0A5S5CEU1_9FLAO|nr:porin [Aquimarina intermedia]TYP77178.1 phosphate-selective porin O/P [Aquimarina intermedia]